MESFVFIDCDGFRLIQSLAWLSVACLNREDDIDSLRFSIPFTWLGIKPTDLITISNLGCTLNVNDSVIAWSIFLRKTYNRLFFSRPNRFREGVKKPFFGTLSQTMGRWGSKVPNFLVKIAIQLFLLVFIGPESDHWECLSLTD